jgi:hypothetical protein
MLVLVVQTIEYSFEQVVLSSILFPSEQLLFLVDFLQFLYETKEYEVQVYGFHSVPILCSFEFLRISIHTRKVVCSMELCLQYPLVRLRV